jgi:hypothetical protein
MTFSPSPGRFILLPQDRQIMAAMGLSEDEYRQLCIEFAKQSHVVEGPQNFLLIPFLINLAIGIALSAAAYLLAPRPRQPGKPARVESKTIDGQSVVNGARYAPLAGFDSVQNVVELGSVIPLIYAKRETIGVTTYGGVRINTNLLWSQMLSLGGSQMLRAVHMVGQAPIGSIDPYQCAFGNNLVGSYDLGPTNNQQGRISIYFSGDGGRIAEADHIAGRLPAYDDGNSVRDGGQDVFCVRGVGNTPQPFTCYTIKPSAQSEFGLYAPMSNGLSLRVNPRFQPMEQVNLIPSGDQGDAKIKCEKDTQVQVQREKQDANYTARSQIIGGPDGAYNGVAKGDLINYRLTSDSDARHSFQVVNPAGPDAFAGSLDAAQTISSRNKAYDSALVVGELYRIGSAMAVCISRSENVYISDADNSPIGGGKAVVAQFRVVETGIYKYTEEYGSPSKYNKINTGTKTSHIMRCAVASFVVDRACQVLEIGFSSQGGISINGLCNFRETKPYEKIDGLSCLLYNNKIIRSGKTQQVQNFSSGTFSGSEERYSFCKIGYRVGGSDSTYTFLPQNFGFRLFGGQLIHNYIRFEFPDAQRWEMTVVPISGWEIRQGGSVNSGDLEVIDFRCKERSIMAGSIVVRFRGEQVPRDESTFELRQGLDPEAYQGQGLGYPYSDDDNYVDNWGKLAEQFIFEEVTANLGSPEHAISYVNVITTNSVVPNYEGVSLLGFNMRASTEFRSIDQFSVYINNGLIGTHLFPEALYDLATNATYGVGGVLSTLQVDKPSFDNSAAWTLNRKYFCDIGISDPINFRSQAREWAAYFLLDLIVQNGKMYLYPMIDFDNPVTTPTTMFGSGNILEDSFNLAYADVSERTSPIVVVSWRREQASGDAANRGLFPVIRSVTVREVGTPETAPVVRLDLSAFCTAEEHAVDVGKMTCRLRRLVTHSVSFKTTPEQALVQLGRTFDLAHETTSYQTPPNGYVANDGSVTCWPDLGDGTHDVRLWDGTQNIIQQTTLTVTNGKAIGKENSIFVLRQPTEGPKSYKTKSIAFDADGNVDIEGEYWPEAELVKDWSTGFFVEGRFSDTTTPPTPPATNTQDYWEVAVNRVQYSELEIATGIVTLKTVANPVGWTTIGMSPLPLVIQPIFGLIFYGGSAGFATGVHYISSVAFIPALPWQFTSYNTYLPTTPAGHEILAGTVRIDYQMRIRTQNTTTGVNTYGPLLTYLDTRMQQNPANATGGRWPNPPTSGGSVDTLPPTVPTALTAVSDVTGITLTWTASQDVSGIKSYDVYRCTGAACVNFAFLSTETDTSYFDAFVTGGTVYRYAVKATDFANNVSALSAPVQATAIVPPDTTPPSTPVGLTATILSATSIRLDWAASTDNIGVTGYGVERCTGAACVNFVEVAVPTANTQTLTDLTASTLHRFRVRAKDAAGNLSAYSSIVEATTPAPVARYWRLTNITVWGNGYLEISELEVYNGATKITGGTISASQATAGGGAVTLLTDGLLNGSSKPYWAAVTNNQMPAGFWLKFTFPAAVQINGIKQGSGDNLNRYMRDACLEYSFDDIAWATYSCGTDITQAAGFYNFGPLFTFP